MRRHSSGDMVYPAPPQRHRRPAGHAAARGQRRCEYGPAMRSRMRRASWAWTRLVSTCRGDWNARLMASRVISWKTARFTGILGFRISRRCQLMASPSLRNLYQFAKGPEMR
jgi:hypothetical protein